MILKWLNALPGIIFQIIFLASISSHVGQRGATPEKNPGYQQWLVEMLNREGKQFSTRVESAKDGSLLLKWE